MAVVLNPYLGFRGQAREALDFYASVLGGAPTISTYGENGMEGDGVMHGQLDVPGGLTLMASDAPPDMQVPTESSVAISLSGGAEDGDTLRRWYEGLSAGGSNVLPLDQAPWGDWFGMFTDRFGTNWMVNIAGAPQEG
ncbi:VOC family protein [Cellulomonas sp. 179-A 9B4 NHS]|uniref:VOC family protein n=1 Tax=Cellulomonas sp. 179-A 9B4 NHS TaxID=3142379 RepID=UPI0039A35C64